MSTEQIRSVIAKREASLPIPVDDRLGLTGDPIYLSSRKIPEGREFVLVHSRPLSGAQMYMFLNQKGVVPNTDTQAHQRKIYDRLVRPNPNRVRERGEDFEDRLQRLHREVDSSGTGYAFSQFIETVGDGWVDSLADSTFDSVLIPIAGMRAFRNFGLKARREVERWQENAINPPPRNRHAREYMLMRLEELLSSEGVTEIREQFKHRTNDLEQLGLNLKAYLPGLPQEQAETVIGRSLSEYRDDGPNHRYAHRLILDLLKERYWYDIPLLYPRERGPQFDMPNITFGGDLLSISDPKNDALSVKISFGDEKDDSSELAWSISDYRFPTSSYSTGRYAAIVWTEDSLGNKEFRSQAETVVAVREVQIPVAGTPDSYLGKLLVKSFGAEGEYIQSVEDKKWLSELGLPNRDFKRPVTDRELPVWIQLPQHQFDLLNSKFISGIQGLAV